ncbi:MAG: ATP-binding protein [Candidatus Promineifilaceae bacterium]
MGPFEARTNGQASVESRAKKLEALLAYLAAEADRSHRRERLVGLLFPELPEEQARTNLRQTLTRLRRAIADQDADPPFLLVTRESTRFNLESDHSLDVADFVRQLEGCHEHRAERDPNCPSCMAHLAAGVALYRGPFLDGFFLEGSAAFEEWVLAKRNYLEQELQVALQELADDHERHGRYAEAVTFVRRQLQIEPWDESAHQQLMRLLAYQGERAAALQQYETLAELLKGELDVDPLPETRTLRDRIRSAASERPYSLPSNYDSFIGREAEMAILHDYLADPHKHLLTVTGPGGSGKTALAVQSGWEAATRFMGPFLDGVYFVPLTGITAEQSPDPTDLTAYYPLLTAVAEAISFSFSGAQPPQEQLRHYLEDKSLLLILDNAEHVIGQVRALQHDLSNHAPGVKLLVTSRERLGLSNEWVVEIEGLPYPGEDLPAESSNIINDDIPIPALQYDSLTLFETLGKRLISDFELEAEAGGRTGPCTIPAAQRIVEQVRGLPLGIELAASWLRILNCSEIADEIAHSLDFLQSTMHDSPSRHRSLRAVFDSSWQLLSDEERLALQRLSVFYGPFDRAAATAVTSANLVMLSSLVDHSLLRRVQITANGKSVLTYELLHVLRQFAVEKLSLEPEDEEQTREKHAHYYLRFVGAQYSNLQGSEQLGAVRAIAQRMKEIRPAWRWAVRNHALALLEEALDGLALYLYMRSWFVEGAELFGMATAAIAYEQKNPETGPLWARLRARQGWFNFLGGNQPEGHAQLLESVAALQQFDDPLALASALSFSAAALAVLGKYEMAQDWASDALALSELSDDAYGSAIANNILSQIALQQADFASAQRHSEASLAIERRLGNKWSLGFSLTNLGRVAFALGDYDKAQTLFRESQMIRETLQDKRGQALCLRYMGETARAQGDSARAQRDLAASLDLFRRMGSQEEAAATLNSLGRLALQMDDKFEAQRTIMEALQLAGQADSMPRLLESLASLAILLSPINTAHSRQLAALIQSHPAANHMSRSQAEDLLAALPPATYPTPGGDSMQQQSAQDLVQLGMQLMADAETTLK